MTKQREGGKKHPLVQASVLIMSGLMLSYTGAFYFEGSSGFAFALVALGVILPLWAMRILWINRNNL